MGQPDASKSSLPTLPFPVDLEGGSVSPPSGVLSLTISVTLQSKCVLFPPPWTVSPSEEEVHSSFCSSHCHRPRKDTEPCSCCVRHIPQAGLELLILLPPPPPPKYYDYRPALLTLAKLLVEEFLSIANRKARHVHGTFIY